MTMGGSVVAIAGGLWAFVQDPPPAVTGEMGLAASIVGVVTALGAIVGPAVRAYLAEKRAARLQQSRDSEMAKELELANQRMELANQRIKHLEEDNQDLKEEVLQSRTWIDRMSRWNPDRPVPKPGPAGPVVQKASESGLFLPAQPDTGLGSPPKS